jgi:hypothetical protein
MFDKQVKQESQSVEVFDMQAYTEKCLGGDIIGFLLMSAQV